MSISLPDYPHITSYDQALHQSQSDAIGFAFSWAMDTAATPDEKLHDRAAELAQDRINGRASEHRLLQLIKDPSDPPSPEDLYKRVYRVTAARLLDPSFPEQMSLWDDLLHDLPGLRDNEHPLSRAWNNLISDSDRNTLAAIEEQADRVTCATLFRTAGRNADGTRIEADRHHHEHTAPQVSAGAQQVMDALASYTWHLQAEGRTDHAADLDNIAQHLHDGTQTLQVHSGDRQPATEQGHLIAGAVDAYAERYRAGGREDVTAELHQLADDMRSGRHTVAPPSGGNGTEATHDALHAVKVSRAMFPRPQQAASPTRHKPPGKHTDPYDPGPDLHR